MSSYKSLGLGYAPSPRVMHFLLGAVLGGLITILMLESSHIFNSPLTHQAADMVSAEKAKLGTLLGSRPTSNIEYEEGEHATQDTNNNTLGFGEVLYVSMPARGDRQDGMNLLGGYTNVKMTLVPGVDGSTIPDKAKPDPLFMNAGPADVGSWRAHADAWRRVMDSDYESALILEDDVDWDVNIHEILGSLSRTMRSANNTLRTYPPTERETQSAPYGLDWDILWLGQCLHLPLEERPDVYVKFHDEHAPAKSQMRDYWREQMEFYDGVTVGEDDKTRLLVPEKAPICIMGYGITKRGAEKLLYHIGYSGLTGPADIAIADRMREGVLKGYAVLPPLITPWKIGGAKDSDISQWSDEMQGHGNDGGSSTDMRNSARKAFAEEYHHNYWEDFERTHPAPGKQETR